jgi:hypothetical protein
MKIAEYRQLKKRGKYNNQKTTYNGREYHSKKEAIRAFELDLLVRARVIKSWTAQPRFDFIHNNIKICSYSGDFRVVYPNGEVQIEDVKGVRTAVYIIKRKLLKAFHGIDIKEIL